ncbi:hypothetical protein L6452_43655 [Arctium lappa]|uniref:Uncharacterized protein n=1 Tax=Arctium lappa TaxID=4217 RepID=A0ACB8XD47_ARCLA|nr:hypothetical protein L6452_43655 [Arctium lappa]
MLRLMAACEGDLIDVLDLRSREISWRFKPSPKEIQVLGQVLVGNSSSDTMLRGVLVMCSRGGYLSEVFRTCFREEQIIVGIK